MKKLTKNDKLIEFERKAHFLLVAKVGKFTMNEIFEEMKAQCEEDVPFEIIKSALLDVLDDLLNRGLMRYYDENDDGKKVYYESSLTEGLSL